MARKGAGAGAPTVDPLDLAAQGLRTAGRALSAAERDARERERELEDPPPAATPEEEAFDDQYEALHHHLANLPTDHNARIEVFFLSPVPPGCEAPHKIPGRIAGDFRAIDDLSDEIERLIQKAGFWGSYKLRLLPKVFCPSPHVSNRGNPCPGKRWHFEGHHDVSLTVRKNDEAAEIAAANSRVTAPGAAAIDPITAARTMLEAGKALTPPAPEKSQAETLGPLVASVATAFEKLASAQSGPTAEIWKTVAPLIPPLLTRVLTPAKDDFLEKLVLMQQAGMLRNGQGGGLRDALEIFRFAMDQADRGGGGERTWTDRAFDFLDRHADSALQRGKELIDLARTRAARAAAAPPPAMPPGTVTATPALLEFQRELTQQAATQNAGYFPMLRERIVTLFPQGGAELLDAVSLDPAADQVGLERLAQAGLTLTPAVIDYLRTFCNWLRYQHRRQGGGAPTVVTPPTPAATNGAGARVRARCENCGTGFELDDEQQWADDSKVCDQPGCGGRLVRV